MDNNDLIRLIFETCTLDMSLLNENLYNDLKDYIEGNSSVLSDIMDYLINSDFDYSTLDDSIRVILLDYATENLSDYCVSGENCSIVDVLELLGYPNEEDLDLLKNYGATYDEIVELTETLIETPSCGYGATLADIHYEDIEDCMIDMLKSGDSERMDKARWCLEDYFDLSNILREAEMYNYDASEDVAANQYDFLINVVDSCASILVEILKDRDLADYIAKTRLYDDDNNNNDCFEYESESEHYIRLLTKAKLLGVSLLPIVQEMTTEAFLDLLDCNESLLTSLNKDVINEVFNRLVISEDLFDYFVNYSPSAVVKFFNHTGRIKHISYSKKTATVLVNNGLDLDFF